MGLGSVSRNADCATGCKAGPYDCAMTKKLPPDAVPGRLGMRFVEDELRREFICGPGAAMTEWASFNLQIALQLATERGWPVEGDYQNRAIGLLAMRLLHAIRGALAVFGSGYEVEGRALVRLVIEVQARLIEIFLDPSPPDNGRRWLEGKPRTRIGEVLRQSHEGVDLTSLNHFYHRLSRDAHADARGILEVFRQPWDGLEESQGVDKVLFGPHASDSEHSLLWLCASAAATTTIFIIAFAEIEHPAQDALFRFNAIVSAHTPSPEALEREGLPETNLHARLNDIFREAAREYSVISMEDR
jgi:hypothetical protein